MLEVKAVIVYPAAIDSVISSFIPCITGEFRIVLDEPPPRVVPPRRLRPERAERTPLERLPELAEEMARAMKERLEIGPEIEWLEPDALERSAHKTRFVEIRGR